VGPLAPRLLAPRGAVVRARWLRLRHLRALRDGRTARPNRAERPEGQGATAAAAPARDGPCYPTRSKELKPERGVRAPGSADMMSIRSAECAAPMAEGPRSDRVEQTDRAETCVSWILLLAGKTEDVQRPLAIQAFALVVYTAAMTAYVFGFEHRPDADYAREIGVDELAIFVSASLLHVGLGAVLGWRALFVVFLPVVIAIPAGEYPGRWPEGPVWAGMFYSAAFLGAPLAALGVGISAIADRRVRRGTPQSV
jgi:hypothetical protein